MHLSVRRCFWPPDSYTIYGCTYRCRSCKDLSEANAAIRKAVQIRVQYPSILVCGRMFLGGSTDDGDQLVSWSLTFAMWTTSTTSSPRFDRSASLLLPLGALTPRTQVHDGSAELDQVRVSPSESEQFSSHLSEHVQPLSRCCRNEREPHRALICILNTPHILEHLPAPPDCAVPYQNFETYCTLSIRMG